MSEVRSTTTSAERGGEIVRGWKRFGEEPGEGRENATINEVWKGDRSGWSNVAEKRKNSLAQVQHWFKALQEEMKINVFELGEEEKEEQENKSGYILKLIYL